MKYTLIQRQQAKSLIDDFEPMLDEIHFKPEEDERKIRSLVAKEASDLTDKEVVASIELYDKYFKNDVLRKQYLKK